MTPSRIWNSIPLKFRIATLMTGFFFVYYSMFGKHHYFDREISAIHTEVEKLMRQANQSGFMRTNFVEAELPAIFRDDLPPSPSPQPPKNATKDTKDSKGKTKKKDKKDTEKKKSGGSDSNSDSDKAAVEKDGKKSGTKDDGDEGSQKDGKDKGKKGIDNKKGGTETSEGGGSDDSSVIKGKAIDAGSDIPALLPTESNMTDDSLPVSASDAAPVTNKTEMGAAVTGLAESNKSTELAPGSVNDRKEGLGAGLSGANDDTNSSSSKTTQVDGAGTGDGSGINADTDAPGATSSDKEDATDGKEDFSKAFGEMDPKDVPEDHIPVLTWNYQSVLDPETPEQIFGLGNLLDHVAAYKPLCLDIANQNAFMFEGQTVCSGFNRTTGWLLQYCTGMQEAMHKEYLLSMQRERKPHAWLTDHASEIRWVEGLTVLQVLEKNCGNIAHFAGRVMLLQHLIDNINAYAGPPSRVMNVLILPTFHIMKRFLYPRNYEFWHKNLLQALVAPSTYTIGTLGNFLYRDSKPRAKSAALVQLLHNFSIEGSGEEDKKFVCFRRAVIPGFLKGRFFINDMEYPSTKPSLQSSKKGAPDVPRDSLRMRERVSALFDNTPAFAKREKEIMLLDRGGSRRVFGKEAREKVLSMMEKVAKEKGYKFTVTKFEKMKFVDQYQAMKKVSIAVGIHGANLVNTMFMPPLSVLFEIFPFGFRHGMYVNGGNSGLKYVSYMMKNGTAFDGPKLYKSVDQCIRLNQQCKVHYRDATLNVNDDDLTEIEEILKGAIEWCDALPGGEGKSRRRRSRRRRKG